MCECSQKTTECVLIQYVEVHYFIFKSCSLYLITGTFIENVFTQKFYLFLFFLNKHS